MYILFSGAVVCNAKLLERHADFSVIIKVNFNEKEKNDNRKSEYFPL